MAWSRGGCEAAQRGCCLDGRQDSQAVCCELRPRDEQSLRPHVATVAACETLECPSLDLLAELDPTIDVRREERFVDDGDTITASGVSAGIDMALHLIVRLAGPDRAREVRHFIQYAPAPPV